MIDRNFDKVEAGGKIDKSGQDPEQSELGQEERNVDPDNGLVATLDRFPQLH